MKFEPAIPLPYMAENYAIKYVSHGVWTTIARTNEPKFTEAARIQTATYLAHAANAYPELVAALKECAIQNREGFAAEEKATALLRKLGEVT